MFSAFTLRLSRSGRSGLLRRRQGPLDRPRSSDCPRPGQFLADGSLALDKPPEAFDDDQPALTDRYAVELTRID
jgi:hypothetical protein